MTSINDYESDGEPKSIQEVDGERIQVVPTEIPRLYEVINLTEANELAEQNDVSMDDALSEYSFQTLVCHQRELVIGTDDPTSVDELQNPDVNSAQEDTGTVYDIAVSRFLGYEMLTYDITGQDVQDLKLYKEQFGAIKWRHISFLKKIKDKYGNVVAAANKLPGLEKEGLV